MNVPTYGHTQYGAFIGVPEEPPAVFLIFSKMADASEQLRCSACSNRFRDPKLLPCLHTFCCGCLDEKVEPANGEASLVVKCPSCDAETSLPRGGVSGLPTNLFISNLIEVVAFQNNQRISCNLCMEGSPAAARCSDCLAFLCEFCEQAHKRQRKTACHRILSVDEAKQDACDAPKRFRSPSVCSTHPGEALGLFCDSCDRLICRDCTLIDHRQHRYSSIADASSRHVAVLARLIGQARSQVVTIREGLRQIEEMSQSLKDRASSVAVEICDVVDAVVTTLQEQKRSLLEDLNKIQQEKLSVLNCQKDLLQKAVDDAETSCRFAAETLREGGEIEVLSMKGPLSNRLQELANSSLPCEPQADDYICFFPSDLVAVFECDEGLGVVEGSGTDPTKCGVDSDSPVIQAKQRKTNVTTVVARDHYGSQRPKGGDQVDAILQSRSGCPIQCTVADCEDGTYTVSYVPEEAGEYRLIVTINNHPLQGSPFFVHVLAKRKRHSGSWHCCTFCSTGGRKDVKCGCHAVMPGGYIGCGHGHPPHPGRKHWSCCGSVIYRSDCTTE